MSIKIVFRPVKKNDKVGYLKIRIIENRVAKFKTLGIKINGNNWNEDKQRVNSKEPNYIQINTKIDEVLREFNNYDTPTLALKTTNKSILQFYNDIINTTINSGTKLKYEGVSGKFKQYLEYNNLNDLKFSQLTPQHVQGFWNYMRESGCATNTANYNLKSFKAMINKAIKSGIVVYSVNPFNTIKLKFTETRHKTLTAENVTTLIDKEFVETRIQRYNSLNVSLRDFANIFLFQLFCQGMRVSDVILLRWQNLSFVNNEILIEYNQFKTQKPIRARLTLLTCKFLIERLKIHYPNINEILIDYDLTKNRIIENIDKANLLLKETEKDKKTYELLALKENMNDKEFTRASWELTQKELLTFYNLQLKELNDNLYAEFGKIINELSQNNPNDFVFHFLRDNNYFKNYKTGEILTKEQYASMTGKRAYYNNILKVIQKQCNINTKLTSHLARHTYTQLLLDSNADLTAVSLSLGHSHLSTTQTYISQLPNNSLSSINNTISNKFDK